MTPAIRLQNVVKTYGSVRAVDDLSLEVAPGEVVCLLGPNSSGKSTVLAVAAGLAIPDSGGVQVAGRHLQVSDPDQPPFIGYVPQTPVFPLRLVCIEILQFHARLRSCSPEAVEQAIESARLPAAVLNRRSGDLSGGMRQRLALAVALIGQPRVLLLDEASSNLDPEAALGFRELIIGMQNQGCAILMATHELVTAAQLAGSVCILVAGRQVQQLTGADLRTRIADSGGLLSPEQIYLEFISHGTR